MMTATDGNVLLLALTHECLKCSSSWYSYRLHDPRCDSHDVYCLEKYLRKEILRSYEDERES